MNKIDPKRFAELEREVKRLKAENQKLIVSHALEKAFYEAGGKKSGDENDYSYFHMVSDHASKFVKVGEQGELTIIDPRDGTRLKTAEGKDYTARDLMIKFKSSSLLNSMFDSSSSATINPANATTREELMQIKDRAERLARARELGN